MKIFITVLFIFFNINFANTQEKIRISSIPDESLSELSTKFKPLINYLESSLNIETEFIPVTDYAAVVEALVSKKIDLAWLGGFTFVQANLRSKDEVIPIVQRVKDQEFKSIFISHKSNNFTTLSDLKNKTFSFGSPSSTSGHLMPRYFLIKEGIYVDDFFKRVAFSGAHDATIFSVLSKKVDAGVVNELIWKKFKSQNKDIADNIDVIFETPPYYDYNWSTSKSIDINIREKIKQAFLKLDIKNKVHKEILDLQRATKFIETNKNNYDAIKQAAFEAKLID